MKFMEKLLVGEKVEWKKLGDLIEKYSEKAQHNKDIKKVYTISKDYGIIPSLEYWENKEQKNEYQIYSEDTGNYNVIRENMFAYNPARLNIGSIDCLFDKEPGLLSPMYVIFKIDEKKIMPNYLLLYLKSSKILQKIDSIKEPGARFRFDFERWNKIEIPLPSLKKQEEVIKKLSSFTKYITELQAELQARNKQYNYYRDMLLSEDYLNKISNKIFMQLDNIIHKTKLIEIAKLIRGKRLVRSELHENGQYPVFQNSLTPLGYYNNKNFDGGKTCIVTAGAAGEIFYQDRDFWAADDVLVITTDDILNKYLYYFLLNKQNLIKSKVRKASVPRLSRDDIEKIEVSLPPIEIQNKIVKILDRFQELLSDTKGLLPLEIEQRRKQYEYYREKLLTFESEEVYALRTEQNRTEQNRTEQRQITSKFFELLKEAAKVVSIDINDKVEWKTLSEVAKYSKDRISFEYLNEKNYVGVENLLKNRLGKIDSNNVPTEGNSVKFNMGDILIGNIRPYLCKIWLADIEGGTNGDVLVISIDKKHKNKILSRYLYQILSDEKFFDYNIKYSKGAKMPRGDKEKIMEYKIPLPPLPVQEYIVSILDKFDALVNDLSQGLPREIELRQKQYEYYREKLLNFGK